MLLDICCFKIGADCEQSLRSRRVWVEKGEVNLFFDAFSSVENLCHFKEETLVTQIVGVRVV